MEGLPQLQNIPENPVPRSSGVPVQWRTGPGAQDVGGAER